MARLVFFSDIHGLHEEVSVPDGDILVFAGDALRYELDWAELADFANWMASLPHKHKIFVAGNHDRVLEKDPASKIVLLERGIIYLENSEVELEGLTFWGSPFSKPFNNWAFMPNDEIRERQWKRVPTLVDVLITHGPARGILDTVEPDQEHLGCHRLREELNRIQPRVHVFGHIHGGAGQEMLGSTNFVNASVLNEDYEVVNSPTVVDLIPSES